MSDIKNHRLCIQQYQSVLILNFFLLFHANIKMTYNKSLTPFISMFYAQNKVQYHHRSLTNKTFKTYSIPNFHVLCILYLMTYSSTSNPTSRNKGVSISKKLVKHSLILFSHFLRSNIYRPRNPYVSISQIQNKNTNLDHKFKTTKV